MARVVTGSILYAFTYGGAIAALLESPTPTNELNLGSVITTTEEIIKSIPAGDERILPLKALVGHLERLILVAVPWKTDIEGSSKAIEDALASGNNDEIGKAVDARNAALEGIETLNKNISASMKSYLQAEENATVAYFRVVAMEVAADVTTNPLFTSNPMYKLSS